MNMEHLIPFKGRNHSGCYEQNLLCRSGSVYLMDNHRAALWCWLQHIDPHVPHSILHIDRHYDTLTSRLNEWMSELPSDWSLGIDEYLAWRYNSPLGEIELFRFDNYLSIYHQLFGTSLASCEMATHQDGEKPRFDHNEHKIWDFPGVAVELINPDHKPWIVNIDLDYFFCDKREDGFHQLASDQYVRAIFDAVRTRLEDGTVDVVTIALSPEFCGGWPPAERLARISLAHLGIDFRLT